MTSSSLTGITSEFKKVLDRLNNKQSEAVHTIEGPVLVIAGPGTGKTQILSARIGVLLASDAQIQAHNILCLTYTDAGAIAMRKRLQELIGPQAYRVPIYTFHAFCNVVIQENLDYFGIKNLQVISDLEKIRLFKSLIDRLPKDHRLMKLKNPYNIQKKLLSLFSDMKKENWTIDDIANGITIYKELIADDPIFKYQKKSGNNNKGDYKSQYFDELQRMDDLLAAAQLFDTYNQLLTDAGRYDFDDMQSWVVRAFKLDVNLLLKYQERFQYILVDEFQDTSGVQLELLHQLLDFWPDPNVFAVGDDDQSIYRFQGANVKNIVEFKEKYEPKVIVLDENYRSSQSILDASMAVIENNNERLINQDVTLTKNLKARGVFADIKIQPSLLEFENSLHEEAAIAEQIIQWSNEGVNLSEVAVLYRNHSQAERLVKVLQKRHIPLNIKRSLNVLEDTLIHHLVNILRYIAYEHKEVNSGEGLLFEMMHFKPFGLNTRDIANYAMHCNAKGYGVSWRKTLTETLTDPNFIFINKKAFVEFENNLNDWILQASNETVQQLFESILTKGKVFQWIMQHSESTFLMELVSTFFDFIKNETAKNPLIHIKELMELIDEMEVNDVRIALDKSIIAANGVQFITAHSSKGLEFEYVWILGCNEKNWKEKNGGNDRYKLPSTLLMKSKEDAEEENRRLFYVAATRAKKQLIISYPKKQNESKENLPSPFLKEMETVLDDKIKTQTITEEVLMQYQMEAMQTPEIIPPVMIDENYIQEFLKKYVLSVTHLNKYLECPIKFYFENILRVPTARSTYMGYGTAIHGALQRLFTSMLKNPNKEFPDVEFLKKVFEEELIKVKSHFTSTQFDNFLFQGKELVLTPYYENYIDTFEKNVWVEYAIKNVEVDGVPINGKLDKIELHSNHKAHVIDYKTGKFDTAKTKLYPPNEKNELGGDYWRQLVFYKIVVEADRSLNLIVETGEMNFVEPDKNNTFHKHVYQITNEDVRLVKTQMKSVYQSIQNMEFENGCNKEDCTWCAFVQSNYTSTPVFSEED